MSQSGNCRLHMEWGNVSKGTVSGGNDVAPRTLSQLISIFLKSLLLSICRLLLLLSICTNAALNIHYRTQQPFFLCQEFFILGLTLKIFRIYSQLKNEHYSNRDCYRLSVRPIKQSLVYKRKIPASLCLFSSFSHYKVQLYVN